MEKHNAELVAENQSLRAEVARLSEGAHHVHSDLERELEHAQQRAEREGDRHSSDRHSANPWEGGGGDVTEWDGVLGSMVH